MNITPLDDADQERLREKRSVVEQRLSNEHLKEKYKSVAGKLDAIHAMLRTEGFQQEQVHEHECLGVILGDAFVQELGMQWIMIEDDSRRTPAIQLPKTSLVLYPMTIIANFIERGAKVNVFELFNGVARMVKESERLSG
jgi:hypothetical protein